MRVTKRIDLAQLQAEMVAAGVAVTALGSAGTIEDGDLDLFTYDEGGSIVDLDADAEPVIAAHVAAPPPAAPDYGDDANQTAALPQIVTQLRAYLGMSNPTGAQTVGALKLTIRGLLFLLRRAVR